MKRVLFIGFYLFVFLIPVFVLSKYLLEKHQAAVSAEMSTRKQEAQREVIRQRRIPFVLSDVYMVDVDKFTDASLWQKYFDGEDPKFSPSIAGGLTLTMEHDKSLILALKGTSQFHFGVPKTKHHNGFVICCWAEHELDVGPHIYAYIPETGELGRDHDWCVTPPVFRNYINKKLFSKP